MKEYNEIKKNIIENFFNKMYKYGCCNNKMFIISDIQQRSMFPCKYDEGTDVLTMVLGDGISVDFSFKWESREHINNGMCYRLVDFN